MTRRRRAAVRAAGAGRVAVASSVLVAPLTRAKVKVTGARGACDTFLPLSLDSDSQRAVAATTVGSLFRLITTSM